jgi:2,4-dienoyl-CoA reductase-like NADH-dependent reductase (Old Yellow Enzyme family)
MKYPMPNLDLLFSSYRLNALNLQNRVVMAPMTRSFSPGGVPTAEVAAYYRRRAENGVGLIITEGTGVGRPAALNEPDVPHFHGEAALAGWKTVLDQVHAAGGRIAPQLWHVGQKRSSAASDWTPPAPYESPSGLSVTAEHVGQPMSEADVADTVDSFARAAADAERLGFDGVELHGAHGYLIDQFFSGDLNLRSDRYGGSTLLERSRFAIEILKAIRSVVTSGFPVILRLSQWKPKDFSARLAETPQALERWLGVLVDAGADAFHLSQPKFWEAAFPEFDAELNLAGWAKKLTASPPSRSGPSDCPVTSTNPFMARVPEPLRWTGYSRGWNAASSTWSQLDARCCRTRHGLRRCGNVGSTRFPTSHQRRSPR